MKKFLFVYFALCLSALAQTTGTPPKAVTKHPVTGDLLEGFNVASGTVLTFKSGSTLNIPDGFIPASKISGLTMGVTSVNSKTGDVVLVASDVGAATEAQGAKADTALQAADITGKADLMGENTFSQLNTFTGAVEISPWLEVTGGGSGALLLYGDGLRINNNTQYSDGKIEFIQGDAPIDLRGDNGILTKQGSGAALTGVVHNWAGLSGVSPGFTGYAPYEIKFEQLGAAVGSKIRTGTGEDNALTLPEEAGTFATREWANGTYATAAQGVKADSALQPGDSIVVNPDQAGGILFAGTDVRLSHYAGEVAVATADGSGYHNFRAEWIVALGGFTGNGSGLSGVVKPGNNVSVLTNDAGYLTNETYPNAMWGAISGSIGDQGDLGALLTNYAKLADGNTFTGDQEFGFATIRSSDSSMHADIIEAYNEASLPFSTTFGGFSFSHYLGEKADLDSPTFTGIVTIEEGSYFNILDGALLSLMDGGRMVLNEGATLNVSAGILTLADGQIDVAKIDGAATAGDIAALEAALAGKRDLVVGNGRIYTTNTLGEQTSMAYASGPSGTTIALRSSSGTLSAATPTSNEHLTTKLYVDTVDAALAGDINTLAADIAIKLDSDGDGSALTGIPKLSEANEFTGYQVTIDTGFIARDYMTYAQVLVEYEQLNWSDGTDAQWLRPNPSFNYQTVYLPADSGTLALTSQIPDVSGKANTSGYYGDLEVGYATMADSAYKAANTFVDFFEVLSYTVSGNSGAFLQTNGNGAALTGVSKPGDNISAFTNDAGYLTDADIPEGAVISVNGQDGIVTLTADDVGAATTGALDAVSLELGDKARLDGGNAWTGEQVFSSGYIDFTEVTVAFADATIDQVVVYGLTSDLATLTDGVSTLSTLLDTKAERDSDNTFTGANVFADIEISAGSIIAGPYWSIDGWGDSYLGYIYVDGVSGSGAELTNIPQSAITGLAATLTGKANLALGNTFTGAQILSGSGSVLSVLSGGATASVLGPNYLRLVNSSDGSVTFVAHTSGSEVTVTAPSSAGTLALTSQLPDISVKVDKPSSVADNSIVRFDGDTGAIQQGYSSGYGATLSDTAGLRLTQSSNYGQLDPSSLTFKKGDETWTIVPDGAGGPTMLLTLPLYSGRLAITTEIPSVAGLAPTDSPTFTGIADFTGTARFLNYFELKDPDEDYPILSWAPGEAWITLRNPTENATQLELSPNYIGFMGGAGAVFNSDIRPGAGSSGEIVNSLPLVSGTLLNDADATVEAAANKILRLNSSGFIDPSTIDLSNASIQFRQGANAERLTTTFASGEPVWTTDTKLLYVGDGSTAGGVAVGASVSGKANLDGGNTFTGQQRITSPDENKVIRTVTVNGSMPYLTVADDENSYNIRVNPYGLDLTNDGGSDGQLRVSGIGTTGGTTTWLLPLLPEGGTVTLATTDDIVGGGGGTGDVVGPAGATSNALALFNGATGKLIKNSPIRFDEENVDYLRLSFVPPSGNTTGTIAWNADYADAFNFSHPITTPQVNIGYGYVMEALYFGEDSNFYIEGGAGDALLGEVTADSIQAGANPSTLDGGVIWTSGDGTLGADRVEVAGTVIASSLIATSEFTADSGSVYTDGTGVLTAPYFVGDGSNLTGISPAQIGAAEDSVVMKTSGDQSITGTKTYTSVQSFSGGAIVTGSTGLNVGASGRFGIASNARSGPGAVTVTSSVTLVTSTGTGDALTLANGNTGQFMTLLHVVDGGSAVLTPATKTGFTTITFTNVGDAVTLYYTGATYGWMVTTVHGATINP